MTEPVRRDLSAAPATLTGTSGVRIRPAASDEHVLLMRLERAASEAGLTHVFPPEHYPYPASAVTERWRRLLRDPLVEVAVLERADGPIGFVAHDTETVRHLGVVPEQVRRGYGSALLHHATAEIFAGGASVAQLWVLTRNHPARSFYASTGWLDTGDRRACEFPPHPAEVRLQLPQTPVLGREPFP